MSLEIKLAYSEEEQEHIKKLFEEYTNLLVELESGFSEYLQIQNYDNEVDSLPEKYGLPNGRLYLAYWDHQAAGCIALKTIDKTSCEVKRLYVRDEYRGHHIADTLVDMIINDARKIGYQFILLDTFPALKGAIKLYEKKGFYKTTPYNDSPLENSIFMRLDL